MQIGAGKRLVVLITQADKMEEDEDEDGEIVLKLRMKSPEEQRGQVEYVRKALKSTRFDPKSEIIPISVKWAAERGNIPKALEESGMADFFRLLNQVAHSEGVRLKCETPSTNLDAFVDHVLGKLDRPRSRRSIHCKRNFVRSLSRLRRQKVHWKGDVRRSL